MPTNKKNEKIKSVSLTLLMILILGGTILILLNVLGMKSDTTISKRTINHNIYAYKSDGTLSIYNTKDKKYTNEIVVNKNKTEVEYESPYNPYEVIKVDDKIYLSSPIENKISIMPNIKELNKVDIVDSVKELKISGEYAAISYLNRKTVDICTLSDFKVVKTYSFKEDVTAIEIDEDNLYVGTGKNIEIISRKNDSEKPRVIFTGDVNVSLCKSIDGYLYAGNAFAADSMNSLLLRVDIKNGNVSDILELGKEYPVRITENKGDLFIACQGLEDETIDGVAVIDKASFVRKTSVSTGNNPNDLFLLNDKYLYVSHDSGQIVMLNVEDNYNNELSISVNSIKSIMAEEVVEVNS